MFIEFYLFFSFILYTA